MIGSVPWSVVRDATNRQTTDADRVVRREFGGPGVEWLLSASHGARSAPHPASSRANRDAGWFRRATQALAAIFLVVSLLPRQP